MINKNIETMEIMIKNCNLLLKQTELKVLFLETDDFFGNGDDTIMEDDPDYGKPMYEACIVDRDYCTVDDTTTGRYCSLQSVYEEMLSFIDKVLKTRAEKIQRFKGNDNE